MTSRHRVCIKIKLVSGAIFTAIFGPYEGKGLLEICNGKQTRKYDYMLNKVACKKENKTKSKLKKRAQTNRLHVCFTLESLYALKGMGLSTTKLNNMFQQ